MGTKNDEATWRRSVDVDILGMVAGGYTMARIIDADPELTNEDVTSALVYASQVIDEEKVIPRA